MDYEIINCYELDVRQDIPAQMELLKSSNEELNNSNRILTVILLSIGLGVILFAVYQSSKKEQMEDDNY
jgi:hypothetical protein